MRPYHWNDGKWMEGFDTPLQLMVTPSVYQPLGTLIPEESCINYGDRYPDITPIEFGEDIQSALDDGKPNQRFLIKGNDHYRRLSHPLVPKAGQKLYGELSWSHGRCVSNSVLVGSIALNSDDFSETQINQKTYWAYQYTASEKREGTKEPASYVFKHDQFNRTKGVWPRPVLNWACEYQNHTDPSASSTVDEALINPRCSDPKALYINNNRLYHVNSLSALESGKFFHDYANRTIYLLEDPTGQHIEFAFNYGAAIAIDNRNKALQKPKELVWKAIEELDIYNSNNNSELRFSNTP